MRRVGIVTGAAGGIGRAVAWKLAETGHDIALFDIDTKGLEVTAHGVTERSGKALVQAGSVTERPSIRQFVDHVAAEFGRIDVLVNNAGILRAAPFLDTTETDWHATFSINLDGAFHFCQAVLPHMVAAKMGSVVNMASWTGKKGVPNHAAYSASKFALIGLTQVMAGEMGVHGVRVNAVCPGIIVETGMRDVAEKSFREQGLPDAATRTRDSVPMKRPGYPAEIAETVSFLCSDAAAYITGESINITGGLWMD